MTVNELRALLEAFPPDMPIMLPGANKWGFDEIRVAAVQEMTETAFKAEHGPAYVEPCHRPSTKPIRAVVLDW